MINQQTIEQAAAIIRAIGGTVIGLTKLQKIAHLLHAADFNEDFKFEYKQYGHTAKTSPLPSHMAIY